MADTEQPVGALTAVMPKEEVSAVPDFRQTMVEAQRQALEGQRRLDARREQLMAAMNTRKSRAFDPSLMRLAAGLLAPTKTGSFGESLGYGIAGMAEEQEKEFLRQQQEAKLAYEIEAAAEQQRRKNLANQMGLQLMQQFGQPSAPSGQPVQLSNVVAPTAGQPVGIAPRQSFVSKIPQEGILGMSLSEDLKPAAEAIMKLREEERKDKIKVKEGNQEREVSTSDYFALENALAQNDYEFAKKWYQKHGLPWNYIEEKRPDGTIGARRMTDAELEAAKAEAVGQKQESFYIPELGRDMPLTPSQYGRYQKEGIDYINKLFKIDQGKPSAEGKGTLPPSAAQKKAEETGLSKRAEEKEKTSAEFAQDLLKRSQMAPEIREAVDDMQSLAKTNPRIYGLLQQPGLMGAVKRAAAETPFRLPTETMETYKLSEKDLEALQNAEFSSSRLQTVFRKLAKTPGEGPISDFETKMFSALALLTKDTPKSIEIKGNLLKARADFDEKLHEEFIRYQDRTGKDYQSFMASSPEYKRAIAEYRSFLKSMRDKNAEYFSRQPRGGASSIEPTQGEGVDKTNKWLR